MLETTYDQIDEELFVEEEIPDILEELSPRKRKKKEKDNQNYIEKNLMWDALKDYYDRCIDHVTCNIPTNLAQMINQIIEEMSHCPNFSGYAKQENWLEDMKGDARVKAFKAVADKSFKLFINAKIVETYKKIGEPDLIFYYDKKAKKGQLSSDKSLFFDTEEHCKKEILSGTIKKGNSVLLKNKESGGYVVINKRSVESEDVINTEENTITFKANPFGFFTTTVWNCFINRIKKEKEEKSKQFLYQEHVYESMYAEESWKNVRRPKILYDNDEDNSFIIESNE